MILAHLSKCNLGCTSQLEEAVGDRTEIVVACPSKSFPQDRETLKLRLVIIQTVILSIKAGNRKGDLRRARLR